MTAFSRFDSPDGSSGAGMRATPARAISPITPHSGSRPRNTHRQPSAEPMTPARAGPATDGMTQALEMRANIVGRCSCG